MRTLYFLIFQLVYFWTQECTSGCNLTLYKQYYSSYTYYPNLREVNFTTAVKECENNGSNLAIFFDENEENHLDCQLESLNTSYNQSHNKGFWIGLKASSIGNSFDNFYWINGSLQTWKNWYDGEPNFNLELCVQKRQTFQLQWNNIPCNFSNYFVCQREKAVKVVNLLKSKKNSTTTAAKATPDATETRSTASETQETSFSVKESISFGEGCNLKATRRNNMSQKLTYNAGKGIQNSNSSYSFEIQSSKNFSLIYSKYTVEGTTYCSKTQTGQTTVDRVYLANTMVEIRPNKNIPDIKVTFGIKINSRLRQEALSPSHYTHKNQGRYQLQEIGYECVYLDPVKRSFSTGGLTIVQSKTNKVECRSNHTTIFAVLLTTKAILIPREAQILSYTLECISLISLASAFIVLTKLRKKIRNKRTFVQINLIVALFLFHLANLFYDLGLKNPRFCEAIAVIIHFSMLSSAAWMFLEGITLAMITTNHALQSYSSKKTNIVRFCIGWGLPALIVTVTTAVGFSYNIYLDQLLPGVYKKCWTSSFGILYGTVVGPIALAIFINIFLLVRVGLFVFNMSKETDSFKPVSELDSKNSNVNVKHARATIRAITILIPVLGVTWILFLLAETSVSLLYLTIIVNGLQGLMVFLVYCVISKEIKEASIEAWKKTQVGKRLTMSKKEPSSQLSTTNNETSFTVQQKTSSTT